MSSSAVTYARDNQQRFLGELKDLLRIPSVSTLPEHKDDVRRAAQFVADEMKRIGMEHVEVIPTTGHPLVYGDWLHAAGKPTVLCYGHYDVQPADPLELWESPPFEPVLKDGYVFARGATDNKGQILSHILGIQEVLEQRRDLPVNLHFVIEGEEEIGSGNLPKFLSYNRDALN